jgi:diguanylate cyclase
MCLPLTVHGDSRGIARPDRASKEWQPRRLGARRRRRRRIITATAEQVALGLANLDLRETLRAQSIRDALTGLFNRRFLIESLEARVPSIDPRRTPAVGA